MSARKIKPMIAAAHLQQVVALLHFTSSCASLTCLIIWFHVVLRVLTSMSAGSVYDSLAPFSHTTDTCPQLSTRSSAKAASCNKGHKCCQEPRRNRVWTIPTNLLTCKVDQSYRQAGQGPYPNHHIVREHAPTKSGYGELRGTASCACQHQLFSPPVS